MSQPSVFIDHAGFWINPRSSEKPDVVALLLDMYDINPKHEVIGRSLSLLHGDARAQQAQDVERAFYRQINNADSRPIARKLNDTIMFQSLWQLFTEPFKSGNVRYP